MKVTVVSSTVFSSPPRGYSGLELVAWQTARGLVEKGHEVTLVAPDGSQSRPDMRLITTGPPGKVDEHGAYQKYWQMLPSQDVVIDSSWNKWSYMLKAEGVLKAPVLGVMHAPVNTMYGSPPPVPKPCIVCISEDQGRHYEALFGGSVRVCRNGIDTDYYNHMGVPRTDRYLFLARFSSIKGPDLAIEACKAAGVGLDLVGDTSITNEPDYLRKCQSMADGKQIRIIGPATRSECVRWFSQAKALLHLTPNFREPLGLAPLESMSCSTPVIAWRHGALQETVKHGETGYLVRSLEEVVELIKTDAVSLIDRDLCRRHVVTNFGVQRMVDRYEELCLEAIETGGW